MTKRRRLPIRSFGSLRLRTALRILMRSGRVFEDLQSPADSAEALRARAVLQDFTDANTSALTSSALAWQAGQLGPAPPPLTRERSIALLARTAQLLEGTRPGGDS